MPERQVGSEGETCSHSGTSSVPPSPPPVSSRHPPHWVSHDIYCHHVVGTTGEQALVLVFSSQCRKESSNSTLLPSLFLPDIHHIGQGMTSTAITRWEQLEDRL